MSRYIQAASLLLVLCAGGLNSAQAADNFEEAVNQFFTQLGENKVDEALDTLYSSNPWMERRQDDVTNLKTQLKQLTTLTGGYRGHQLLLQKDVAGRLVYLSYFVAYERQPVRFEFQFYRPGDSWMTFSFQFDTNLDDDLETHGRSEALSAQSAEEASRRLALAR